MSKRREYEEKVRAKLVELEREVNRLQKQIQEMESDLLPEHHSKLEQITELTARAKDKLEELAEAGEDSWEHLVDGIEHYWKAIGNEVKSFEKL